MYLLQPNQQGSFFFLSLNGQIKKKTSVSYQEAIKLMVISDREEKREKETGGV